MNKAYEQEVHMKVSIKLIKVGSILSLKKQIKTTTYYY